MKMNFFFGYPFWGLLLIIWGVSLILKSFDIHLPLVRVFVGIAVVFFGINILLKSGSINIRSKGKSDGKSYIRVNSSGDYNMIFSSGTIDLRELKADSDDIEISVVFASATVLLPDDMPFTIEPTTVFGQTYTHKAKSTVKEGVRPIKIESSCVFGSVEYLTEARDAESRQEEINPQAETDGVGDF